MTYLPLPVVDLAEAPKSAAHALREACTEHGFFFVINHGVPTAATEQQFAESKAFFQLPESDKLETEAKGNRGYTRLGEQTLDPDGQKKGDTKESYYICQPEAPEGSEEAKLPFHGPNRWPARSPGFQPAMEAYMRHLDRVYLRLLRLIAVALELSEDYFSDFFDNAILTLRPIHYTAEQSSASDGVFGAGAHTDWGFITLLDTNNTPGLQIRYKGQWMAVPCLQQALVVNIGDLLQRWTNGVFKSTLHRVINETPGHERYSCAYFISPRYDAQIRCLPSCVGEGAKYEAVTCADYLTMKYKQTHAKFRS